jgi:hypothetical protein
VFEEQQRRPVGCLTREGGRHGSGSGAVLRVAAVAARD